MSEFSTVAGGLAANKQASQEHATATQSQYWLWPRSSFSKLGEA